MRQILHYLKDPKTMGIMAYSLLWVMHDLYHQQYLSKATLWGPVPTCLQHPEVLLSPEEKV